ncbi:tyrosine-type recombinase/integrase [Thalassoroseus pseudoceratinae]|uniref:tyrosine-type recombinase/integrase n=1 Tax=Thalassoroseus pseudoceratinae TaxID=2713176 RepID=UPI001423E6F9|nr:tyrosine-type recombinase/integrase [Thalassoroseus pseudoceratinae]
MTTKHSARQRRSRGKAWHWKQTDSWYFTPPGTKQRVRLYDEAGRPIRGQDNRQAAELALARVKAAGNWRPSPEHAPENQWQVAKICSHYIDYCQQRAAAGTIRTEYHEEVVRYLNDFCGYCGALPVNELRKGHVQHWVVSHDSWKSPVTKRNAMTIVLGAFNHAQDMYDVRSPLTGLKKPPQKPRLHSIDPEEEALLYSTTDEPFANFLFAGIQTGLRPFCELARLTATDVEETDRGMLWRIFSSKTQKTRKIPVRSDVAELTRNLISDNTDGSETVVFRNPQGRPWKKGTGGTRFRKIKRELGWDQDPVRKNYSCYTCRHTFAHRMLAGFWNDGVGCSIETLAELMGDTPKVAFDHYGREWGQHYQEPLWAALGIP